MAGRCQLGRTGEVVAGRRYAGLDVNLRVRLSHVVQRRGDGKKLVAYPVSPVAVRGMIVRTYEHEAYVLSRTAPRKRVQALDEPCPVRLGLLLARLHRHGSKGGNETRILA